MEHPFRVIERRFGHVKVRYRTLNNNSQQLMTLSALNNSWMMRSKLMGAQAWMRLKTGKVHRKVYRSLK